MATIIYLTRHGQTMWNLEKRLQGQANSELTEAGLRGAELLRDRMKDIHIDNIYTSPIKRAYETAKIIKGDKNINIITDDRLKEFNFGDYEGHIEEELLKEGRGKELLGIFNWKMDERAPNGECLNDIKKRIKLFFDNILEVEKDKSILIVTHGLALKVIMTYFNDKELFNSIMGQTTLTKVICKDREFLFEFIDDGSHLNKFEEKVGW